METTEAKNKTYYFYVLHCADNSFYGGFTTDLKRREEEHSQGVGAKYTKVASKRPLRMIYAESYPTRSLATKAEYAFKKLRRSQKETYLKKQGIQFPLVRQRDCLVKEGAIISEDTEELCRR